jgi:hypothetical protein
VTVVSRGILGGILNCFHHQVADFHSLVLGKDFEYYMFRGFREKEQGKAKKTLSNDSNVAATIAFWK